MALPNYSVCPNQNTFVFTRSAKPKTHSCLASCKAFPPPLTCLCCHCPLYNSFFSCWNFTVVVRSGSVWYNFTLHSPLGHVLWCRGRNLVVTIVRVCVFHFTCGQIFRILYQTLSSETDWGRNFRSRKWIRKTNKLFHSWLQIPKASWRQNLQASVMMLRMLCTYEKWRKKKNWCHQFCAILNFKLGKI